MYLSHLSTRIQICSAYVHLCIQFLFWVLFPDDTYYIVDKGLYCLECVLKLP
jgi:hypothetical protein